MSVVVRMEMPKGCRSCQLCVFAGASPVCVLRKYPNCTVSQFFVKNKRPSNCPIVCALPEKHGRLVDADALLRDIEKYHVSEGKFQHWLELQPTIVPATEGGKE